MTTLLTTDTRRCNARCHHSPADAETCRCICGGVLHGTHRRATKELEAALRRGDLTPGLVVDEFSHLCDEPLPGL